MDFIFIYLWNIRDVDAESETPRNSRGRMCLSVNVSLVNPNLSTAWGTRILSFLRFSSRSPSHCRENHCLQNRSLLTLSSPLCNKQGNRIQVLRIPPFVTCSFWSFSLLLSVSRELVRAFFFLPFCPLPFEPCALFPRRVEIGFHQLVERFIARPFYHKYRTV